MPEDKVLMLGAKNATYFELPNAKDLIVIKQEHVVLVQESEFPSYGERREKGLE